MYILEDFTVGNAPMEAVDRIITDRDLMKRWASPTVQFTPRNGWTFEQGAEWTLTLTGLGPLLKANYVVYDRKPGLILWYYNGFWEGFDAWHWWRAPNNPQHQTIIQNRLEFELRVPGLDIIWLPIMTPLMRLDMRIQMQRLHGVCNNHQKLLAAPAAA